jgi:hypothetical protein
MKLAHYVTGQRCRFRKSQKRLWARRWSGIDGHEADQRLVGLAMKETDHLAQNFLQWFVNEQLEEVSTMEMLLTNVRRAGDDLLRIDDFVGRLSKAAAGASGADAT